jgi:DNA-binding LytR/AlgR family response regulator
VFDFIVMPLEEDKLRNAIEKAVFHINKYIHIKLSQKFKNNVKIRVNTTNGYRLVNLDSLSYCIADGSYTKICFSNGKTEFSSYYLGKIEKTLIDYHFVRISRSVIVNLKKIKKIEIKNI